ncbi:MAG: four helix bundle protein [Ardenticatenaceae bacterium]|nr:four helix bundle protein [Anaerolineales bacterium]MCB8920611.1 four helix bundle protein [Ardenticatenaceae bacterium]MCB8990235.1 four helix bundle protein [Ardenticatenaceae bacterium]MCB9002973.1 four helix bundle protein [Ardenticatenaceae bacterium]
MGFKFEKLEVWRRSVEYADKLFQVVDTLPAKYQSSLGDQLRRAALSIPTNIAEGSGRDSDKSRVYFYRIAKGSVYETISLLVMIGKRGALDRDAYRTHYQEANEIAAILTKLANPSPKT